MLNKKWMILGLFIGNLLMTAIAAASPMYSQAVLQRMLTENLVAHMEETGEYPGKISLLSSYNHVTGTQENGWKDSKSRKSLWRSSPKRPIRLQRNPLLNMEPLL